MNNLTIKRNDGVLIIELNRAPVNALSFNYLKEIKSEFLKAEKDNNIQEMLKAIKRSLGIILWRRKQFITKKY